MVSLSGLMEVASNATVKATDFIKNNLGTIAATTGGVAVGAALGVAATTRRKSSKRRKSKPKTRKRKATSYKRKRRVRKTPHTAGKRKDTSHRRIRHTKNGQPYIILASGKARFIKKSSARSSRKKKGGRY